VEKHQITLDLFQKHNQLKEIQRIANLVPQNVWHKTTKDTTINGHFIAKGVAIVPQVSVVLNDEKVRKYLFIKFFVLGFYYMRHIPFYS
jgi:hypothetical protein